MYFRPLERLSASERVTAIPNPVAGSYQIQSVTEAAGPNLIETLVSVNNLGFWVCPADDGSMINACSAFNLTAIYATIAAEAKRAEAVEASLYSNTTAEVSRAKSAESAIN